MKHYPLFFNLKGRKAIVFGGGAVAERKIRSLLQSGAQVHAVSCEFAPAVRALARKTARLKLEPAKASPKRALAKLLKNADLAFAATSDAAWNRLVVKHCRRLRIPVNVADQPELCDFFVPSYFKKGDLEVAVSTGGASPLWARRFREELESKLRPEAIRLLGKLKKQRPGARRKFATAGKRREFFAGQIGAGFHFLNGGKSKS